MREPYGVLRARDTVESPKLKSAQGLINVVMITSSQRINVGGRRGRWADLIRPFEWASEVPQLTALARIRRPEKMAAVGRNPVPGRTAAPTASIPVNIPGRATALLGRASDAMRM
jgi:hypothetical protein